MNKLFAVLGSSTLWTVIITVLINAVPAFRNLIPAGILPFVDAILIALSAYFHVDSVDRAYDSAGTPTVVKGAESFKRTY